MSDSSFKIVEALQKDIGRGRIRIHETVLRKLKINPGDIVQLKTGDKKTGAVAWPAEKEFLETESVRIDGITRRNLGVKLNDSITISSSPETKIAETVKITAYHDVRIDRTVKQYVK